MVWVVGECGVLVVVLEVVAVLVKVMVVVVVLAALVVNVLWWRVGGGVYVAKSCYFGSAAR